MEGQLNSNCVHNDDEALMKSIIACGSGILQNVLNAAIQLDIFEIIHKAGDEARVSAYEIVSQLPTNNNREGVHVLDTMLRLLTSHSFLTCSITRRSNRVERFYGLAPAGKCFIKKDESGMSMAQFSYLCCQDKPIDIRDGLKDAVLEGGDLLERFHRKSFYEFNSSNPRSNKLFNDAMASISSILMEKTLKIYNGFEGLNSIVDVGGGNGVTLEMILSKYPHIHGINFDLPEVIQTAAPSYNGIKHISGDMFVEVPSGDAMLLKSILHNWNDDQCLKLLTNCYKALPNKGKVIAMDAILPEIPQTDIHSKYAAQMDVAMLSICGGKERTETEFETMAIQVGFSEFKVVGCAHGTSIMELIK